jgi:hypothetical protein
MKVALNSARAKAYASALYLDQYEEGGFREGMSALNYREHAQTLKQILAQGPSRYTFSDLLRNSPAAQEIAEGLELERRIEVSRAAHCPVLNTLMKRI